ncbi:hypothetical protein F5Y18DRAFT_396590 [Xylariaceae sp. FL1019]|nr:hypothetical protein F5Y18DRAFT_396590 [Xylariaceae sp. FL1019]
MLNRTQDGLNTLKALLLVQLTRPEKGSWFSLHPPDKPPLGFALLEWTSMFPAVAKIAVLAASRPCPHRNAPQITYIAQGRRFAVYRGWRLPSRKIDIVCATATFSKASEASGQQTSSQCNPPSLSQPASSSSGYQATIHENASVSMAQHDQRQMNGQQGYYDPQYSTSEQQHHGLQEYEGWLPLFHRRGQVLGQNQGADEEEDTEQDTSIDDQDEIYPRNYRYPSL